MTRRRGRLALLRPVTGTLRPSVAYMPEGEKESDRHRNAQAWRGWYRTARWKALRAAILLRDLYTCRLCGRVEGDTSQLVADHRRPHRGDETLFWDEANLQALCAHCHNSVKQREENAGRWRA